VSLLARIYHLQVSLGDVTVIAQSIGVANFSIGFDGFDGIIGFGPVGLTNGTVEGTPQVQTFMQNLVSQGQISANVMGISFEPENGAVSSSLHSLMTGWSTHSYSNSTGHG
jgi:hypothetical protein